MNQTIFFRVTRMRTEKGGGGREGKKQSGNPTRVFGTLTEICQSHQIVVFARLNSSKSSTKFLRPLLHRNAGGLSRRMTQLAIHSGRLGSNKARMLALTYAHMYMCTTSQKEPNT